MLSWQKIWNSRKVTEDIKEKLANQKEVLCEGISRIYCSLSNKWKPCHRATNNRVSNLRAALQKYFQFYWNWKQIRTEKRNNNVKLWEYFYSMVLGCEGKDYHKKQSGRILANIFWLLPQRLLLKQNVNRSTTDDGYIRHPYFFNHALDEYIRHKTHQMTCFQEK